VNNQSQPEDLAVRGNGSALKTMTRRSTFKSSLSACFRRFRDSGLTLLENLLRQVVLVADFLDLVKLSFDPIDMVLFVDDNMF
jgi:hypothetical protein